MSEQAQADVDHLLGELQKGNDRAGVGTRPLGGGFYELRGRNGGRVIVKAESAGSYVIVGKFQGHVRGDAANSEIINRLKGDYVERHKPKK
jgi:hypothetical protein